MCEPTGGLWLRVNVRTWAGGRYSAVHKHQLAIPAWLLPGLLISAGLALRIIPWLVNYPLHHDEALYGYWARLIASDRDPLLLTAWVDKPPLVPYVLAGSLKLFGVSELALRLPGMVASIATLGCTFGLARSIYGNTPGAAQMIALCAALLFAFSPFAILFGPTAFTDSWLTLWLAAAAWAATARRPFWAGVMLGLAIASKQQGALGVPLVVGLIVADPTWHGRRLWQRLGALALVVLGFALIFAPVSYWDSLRFATRPSFWDRSLTTYGGLGLAPLAAWPERAAGWAGVLGTLFGLPLLSAVMMGLAIAGGVWGAQPRRAQPTSRRMLCGAAQMSAFLLAYVIAYLLLHFVVTFQPWDRYLLPLLPFLCLLAANGLWHAWNGLASIGRRVGDAHRAESGRVGKPARAAAAMVLLALLTWGAWQGVTARLPVGSDHGAYAGLDRIAAFLRDQPADAVIYHRWIGWHFDFYLFDAPQERRWWGTGWKLAEDAATTLQEDPGRPQWLVLPGWQDTAVAEVRLALMSRKLALSEVERSYRPDGSRAFTVYRIVPAGQAGAAQTGAAQM